jgi:tetratricopeptide (TPR) repeat protein
VLLNYLSTIRGAVHLALYYLGRYNEAIKAYDNATKLDLKFARAWNNKGLVFYEQGRYYESIRAYEEAIKIDSQYAKAWNNKGNALQAINRTVDATSAFSNARMFGYEGSIDLGSACSG